MIIPKYRPRGLGRDAGYADLVERFGGSRDRAERYQFVTDVVGNTICADLLDYLRRDHLFTGLPLAVGSRYLASFYVTPKANEPYYPQRMVLRITRDGRERVDVVTELLKHLRYRYELSERALVHHAKLAADAMIGKAIEMCRTIGGTKPRL
jgi:HD superfamily phosphohydrolase